MKAIRVIGIALLLGVVANCTVHAQPPGYNSYNNQNDDRGYADQGGPQVDVGFFYNELSPYGDWVRTPSYGWAWFPRNVQPYWRPYNNGRWMNTDYGWTWDSYEPFGWATYHYGRWTLDPHFGWLWIPGTVWGPAWVSWQSGGGYVGWAPLPPAVGIQVGVGLQLGGFNLSIGIRPDAYNFVPERSFLQSRLSGYMMPTARNVTIFTNTTNITHYGYVGNRVVNRGIDRQRIERVTGRHLQRYNVSDAREKTRSRVSGRELRIYRPDRRQLDSVRIGERANAGIRGGSSPQGRDHGQASTQRREAPPLIVAPRVRSAPRLDVRKIDRQDRKEQARLGRYQASEKQRIEKAHRQDVAKAKAHSDRGQIEHRHQAELQALHEEQQDAARQLQARQNAKRQVVIESQPPPRKGRHGDKKAAAPKHEKQSKGQQKEKHGRGQDKKPKPPPPGRI